MSFYRSLDQFVLLKSLSRNDHIALNSHRVCWCCVSGFRLNRGSAEMTMNMDDEIERVKTEIERLGAKNDDGSVTVKFGTLFNDERCANIFEALVGTLGAAKKRKIVTLDLEMLFQAVHDNVDTILVEPKAG